MPYMTRDEEQAIRNLLDELAKEWGFICDNKEAYRLGFYIDRLWYVAMEGEKIPFVAFEIEKNIPNNERIRKDISNLISSRAPVGYIILPHFRILEDPKTEQGSTGQNWYKYTFRKTLKAYREPFAFYCEIRVVDADKLLSSRSIKEAIVTLGEE